MTNHTLEKPNDWWRLHTQNLVKIHATPPKVANTFLPWERERESTWSSARTTPIIKRGLQWASRTWEHRHGGWSNEGLTVFSNRGQASTETLSSKGIAIGWEVSQKVEILCSQLSPQISIEWPLTTCHQVPCKKIDWAAIMLCHA